ncbi:sensor histidine kinase [Saccharibacillus sacchari]|uniref:sensor histidine kinase n=1 Tax=Saccharibacillus sacchari TaxID=456493 RepID=UPI0004B05D9C|nr:HAMP domain-containing sensor histidine kinase [Saccharibacillus sacchari]
MSVTERKQGIEHAGTIVDTPFWRLALPFASGVSFLTIAYAGWLSGAAYQDQSREGAVIATVVFLLLMLGIAALWLLHIRRLTLHFLQSVHEIADGVIRGESRRLGYTESTLSLLEHKLSRFAEWVRGRQEEIGSEKENIQRLIADISHQTKTPLANMLLYTQLLEEKVGDQTQTKSWVAAIREQADKLHFLIRSLIDMSRLETGILTMNLARSSLLDTVRQAVSQVYVAAERADVTLSVRMDAEHEVQACHDAKWTAEALFNLLDNAVKYGRRGGEVEVSLSVGDVFARVDIADNGPGIDENERAGIFGRFKRGRSAGQSEGVGLGLYLAREIVHAQGGRIRAGVSKQGGALFSVWLPI